MKNRITESRIAAQRDRRKRLAFATGSQGTTAVEVSDTTGGESSNTAGNKKIYAMPT